MATAMPTANRPLIACWTLSRRTEAEQEHQEGGTERGPDAGPQAADASWRR